MGVAHWPQFMRNSKGARKRIGQIVAAMQRAPTNHFAEGGHHDDSMHLWAISERLSRLND